MLSNRVLKQLYFRALDILQIDKLKLKKLKSDKKVTILNLHKISNETNLYYPALNLKLFEMLLIYITKNFNVITFNQLSFHSENIKPYLILSFDDGFHDFLDYAVPLLKKYQLKANLNVIPQCIMTGKPIWDVLLGDILNQSPIERINSLNLPNFNLKLTKHNEGVFGLALTRYLKQMYKEQREDIWMVFNALADELNVQFTQMLSKDEILEISKTHEIGVHSYSHESMGQESFDFFEKDFNQCKAFFGDCLKQPMNIYAFPSGSYEQNQIDFLLENGIEHVLLVNEQYSKVDANIHNRFTYYANSKSEVKLRALGFHR